MAKVAQRVWQYVRQPWRLAVPLKRLIVFLAVVSSAALIYWWAIQNLGINTHGVISIIILWVMTAYFLLPRIHRFLSKIYVPDYFIGRVRTPDGLLCDPVNIAIRGNKSHLVKAMREAGWHQADELTLQTGVKIVKATVLRRSYPNAPVMDLFLFGRRHDMAFQKEVDGNPAKRHHVRFWHTPEDGYLPGGHQVDWVAAATYDDAVGISLTTLQVVHGLDGDVDEERDFLVDTLRTTTPYRGVELIEHFFPQYEHFNAINGDKFFTDGAMVIVDLKQGTAA